MDSFSPLGKFAICIGKWICHSKYNEGGCCCDFGDKHDDGRKIKEITTSVISTTEKKQRVKQIGIFENSKFRLLVLGEILPIYSCTSYCTFRLCTSSLLPGRQCPKLATFQFHEAMLGTGTSLLLYVMCHLLLFVS